ncbi:ArnT family glycosyltransferase [Croceivirga thetidis]|uniref:Glycosyltransferase family 39 protein n=1 Tax=Croceivirga thetidis TaxID=2721623 RepID=A0ABX1GNW2_9FLAO|nr:glycosyltransferase family 39 protein [Croceivirga thetidis]NKI31584.1 glycosyltransferase family 39 protein [Croceivirga thetidis]
MSDKFPKLFLVFLGVLFLLNILQSFFTELIYDEAYYWYYAQDLDWGYFDHPPMVALMIKLGSLFFDGELGVRFLSCLFSAGTAMVLWLLIDNPKKLEYQPHFFLLVFSLPLLNAYGFLTLPDTPLLFFTAVFLLIYKSFLQKETAIKAIVLGIIMAAMMYSKYHAALVIIFVLLSNPILLKNKLSWLALIVSLVCYAPHQFWLFDNEFVTLNFHMNERPNQAYSFEGFTLGYLLNLIVIFGLLFPVMYWALFKSKEKDKFSKALRFLVFGFIIFFFISSFNRRTQTQWVVVICIPMVVLAFNFILQEIKARKWVFRLGLVSTALLLYARIGLIYEPLFPVIYETHGNKDFAQRIVDTVGDIPVVFENSYRRPSMFSFYSQNPSYTQNNLFYRYSQYAIDDSEDKIRNKKVAYLSKYYKGKDFEIEYKDGSVFYGEIIDDFKSYRKLKCFLEEDGVAAGDQVKIKVFNPYSFDIQIQELKFYIGFMNAYKQMRESEPLVVDYSSLKSSIPSKDTLLLKTKIPKPKKPEMKYIRFGILENGIYPGINSSPYKFNGSN